MEEEEAFADSGGSCARIFIFVLFFGGKGGFGPFATSTVFWSFFAISRHSSVTRKSFCEFGRFFFFFLLLFLLSSRAKLTNSPF